MYYYFQIDFERDADGNRLPPLGAGSFGCVYKAIDGCKKLAIKVIDIWNDEFLREIRNHSTFRHKNIIQFRGWRQGEGGTIEIIMDRVDGGTLTSQVYILLQAPIFELCVEKQQENFRKWNKSKDYFKSKRIF